MRESGEIHKEKRCWLTFAVPFQETGIISSKGEVSISSSDRDLGGHTL